jgi:hypothetical protein
MDVVGPVTESSSGNKYILVVSDYASRYVITIPMEDQKAHTIAEHLVKNWLKRCACYLKLNRLKLLVITHKPMG